MKKVTVAPSQPKAEDRANARRDALAISGARGVCRYPNANLFASRRLGTGLAGLRLPNFSSSNIKSFLNLSSQLRTTRLSRRRLMKMIVFGSLLSSMLLLHLQHSNAKQINVCVSEFERRQTCRGVIGAFFHHLLKVLLLKPPRSHMIS